MAGSMSAGTAYVDLTVGKTDTLTKGAQSAGKEAGEHGGSTFKEGFMSTAKSLVGPLAALFAVEKIKDFVKEGIKGAEAAQQASRLTEQVITSTGQAANVSSKDVDKLSMSLSAKTAVDNDVIHSGANLMLTFTNVKNAAGKNNDIFNQSVGIANDMSKALGQDMKSSVMQLGKALNDPVKGMSALRRVGVSFTADQTAQVKALTASGNAMGAQKIILAELNKEFGGAAKAMADPIQRVKIATDDLGKSIGGLFLGPMKVGATGIADLEDKAIHFFESLQEKEAAFGQKSKAAMDAVKAGWAGATPPPPDGIAAAFWNLGDKIKGIVLGIKDQVHTVFASFMSGMSIGGVDSLSGAFGKLKDVFSVLTPIMNPFSLILKALAPVLPQIAGMIGQVAGILINGLAAAATQLMPVLNEVIQVISQVAVILVGALGQAITALLPAFPPLIQAVSSIVQALAGGLMEVIKGILPILPPIAKLFGELASAIGGALSSAIQILVPVLSPLLKMLMDLISAILTPLLPLLNVLIQAFGSILKAVAPLLPVLATLIMGLLSIIMPIIQPLIPIISLLANIIGFVLGAAINLVVPVITGFINVVVRLGSALGSAFSGAAGVISGAFQGIVGAIKWPINVIIGMINSVIRAIDSISVDTPLGHIGFSIAQIPSLAEGGVVPPSPGGRLVRVAEAGEAEAVIPLSKLKGMSGTGSQGGNQTKNEITIHTQAVDGVAIANTLQNQLMHAARAY